MVHWKKRQKIKADIEADINNPGREVKLSKKLIADAFAYVKRHLVAEPKTGRKSSPSAMKAAKGKNTAHFSSDKGLDIYLKQEKQNESFAKYLTKQLEERGITFKELCKSLYIDRKRVEAFELDSPVNPYRPDKNYVLLMGLQMQMNLEEMNALLAKAGYTLSDSIEKDLTIKYCIKEKIYDCFKVDHLVYETTGKSLRRTRKSDEDNPPKKSAPKARV